MEQSTEIKNSSLNFSIFYLFIRCNYDYIQWVTLKNQWEKNWHNLIKESETVKSYYDNTYAYYMRYPSLMFYIFIMCEGGP